MSSLSVCTFNTLLSSLLSSFQAQFQLSLSISSPVTTCLVLTYSTARAGLSHHCKCNAAKEAWSRVSTSTSTITISKYILYWFVYSPPRPVNATSTRAR
ncbi:hypothetical protein PLICRDRAFT_33960 [Plicaturopsis crispa FD-325 SS-3]|nr:hypothetical protein PLICRDRAFT_33960 [Plicaturopsis crispa FD-325 SS-3]